MKNLLGVHHIPIHQTGWHSDFFHRISPAVYKVVISGQTVDLSYCPAGAQLVVRSHPVSENYGHRSASDALLPPSAFGSRAAIAGDDAEFRREYPVRRPVVLPEMVAPSRAAPHLAASAADARQCGIEHADAYAVIAGNLPAAVRTRAAFSALNEPQLWSVEPPYLHAAYSLGFVERMHSHGLRAVWGCFGVGWPGNDGPGMKPVWGPWYDVAAAMLPGDMIEVHEYWWDGGPANNWGWWAGRYVQCPFNRPIFIGEAGRDGGVVGLPKQGWMSLPGDWPTKADTYMAELAWYEQRLREDARIVGQTPFTCDGDGQDWSQFEVLQQDLMARMTQYQDWVHSDPDPLSLEEALHAAAEEHDVLAVNPDAALAKQGLREGLWPTSNEFPLRYGGVDYVAQRFRDPGSNDVYVLYCVKDQWGTIEEIIY